MALAIQGKMLGQISMQLSRSVRSDAKAPRSQVSPIARYRSGYRLCVVKMSPLDEGFDLGASR